MAQMFSSGVTPDYLKALSDAYAQYFPQQAPVNTQALQQWYSPSGSSAFGAPMDASAPSQSVVGSLFGEQYPQTAGGGSKGTDRLPMSAQQQAFFDNETPAERDARMANVGNTLSSLLGGAAGFGLFGPLPALAMKAYNYMNPYGRASTLSNANLATAIQGQDLANLRDIPDYSFSSSSAPKLSDTALSTAISQQDAANSRDND